MRPIISVVTTKESKETSCSSLLEELSPERPTGVDRYDDLIRCDRPDRRHRRDAIDASKIGQELGWTPAESFESGLSTDGPLVLG